MPHGELHERKKKKNYTVLLAIAVFAVVIFAVTIIRMGASQ